MHRFLGVVVIVLGMIGLSSAEAGEVTFETSRLDLVTASGTHAFTVELAVTDAQLSQGLMHRPAMSEQAGMLFDFGEDQMVSMWMRNTLISLDMFFIDRQGAIVGIAERTTPLSTRMINSPGPVRAVLELNAGTAKRLGVRPGDRIHHPMFNP